MESKLYEASVKGNVPSLLELLAKDKLLLDRIMTGNHTETPLHIAAMLGHLEFVEEVLARKAELAGEQDSQNSTPLHLAAAKGYLNIVASLLRVSPDICFVRDKCGRNPLHVAAMKGRVDVLECLVRARPDAARSVVDNGQTILHLCVKHNKLEALKLLIDILGDDQFINSTDDYGNTILHLAAADRQTKTIYFLIQKGLSPNITNSESFTALDLLAQGESAVENSVSQTLKNEKKNKEAEREKERKWQERKHQTLLVVASLLATMAFQANITPPGGNWQDDFPGDNTTAPHFAGVSIMADVFPYAYRYFVVCNTVSIIASLGVILLHISGLPLKRSRIYMGVVMLTMWVAITFTVASYAIPIIIFNVGWSTNDTPSPNNTVRSAVLAWVGFMTLLFLCHFVRLIRNIRKASTNQKPEDHRV